jgi:hypothetical protein
MQDTGRDTVGNDGRCAKALSQSAWNAPQNTHGRKSAGLEFCRNGATNRKIAF